MKTLVIALLLGATVPTPAAPQLEERLSYYHDGRLAERRHFYNGREAGLQQAWTEDGTLYVNYEMRNGRRHGFINARPCRPVEEAR